MSIERERDMREVVVAVVVVVVRFGESIESATKCCRLADVGILVVKKNVSQRVIGKDRYYFHITFCASCTSCFFTYQHTIGLIII